MLPESNHKREKFVVEINRKRNAKLINQSRKRNVQQKPVQKDDPLNKILIEAKQQKVQGFEALIAQYMTGGGHFDVQKLVNTVITTANLQQFTMLIPILNAAYQTEDEIETPKNLWPLLSRCQMTLKQPYGKLSLQLINTLTIKQAGVCEKLISSEGMLETLVELSLNSQLYFLVESIFKNISDELLKVLSISKDSELILRIMQFLLKMQEMTCKGSYIGMIKEILQDIDDEEFGLNFLQRNMGTLHNLCVIIKQNNPANLQRKQIMAQILQLLFYSDQHIVATLLLSGFGEYIEFMVQDPDSEVQSSGFVCLESILLADNEEIVGYVRETNLVESLSQAFEKYFKEPTVKATKVELNLMRAAIAILENSEYQSKLATDYFIWNCGARLENQYLTYETLTLIQNIITKDNKYCKTLQSKGIIQQIEVILASDSDIMGISDQCTRILQIYEASSEPIK